jgi:hypothetical protein
MVQKILRVDHVTGGIAPIPWRHQLYGVAMAEKRKKYDRESVRGRALDTAGGSSCSVTGGRSCAPL